MSAAFSTHNLRTIIAGLREEGVAVFLTTHYLEEAEQLCDRIALLVTDHIVALDTVEGLKANVREEAVVEVVLSNRDASAPEGQRLVDADVEATNTEALNQRQRVPRPNCQTFVLWHN